MTISVTKDGVKFSATGDIGSANINVRPQAASDKEEQTQIDLNEPVSLTFALRYLNSFSKATPLSNQVQLSLSKELPIVVEYRVADLGYVRYFLAPSALLLLPPVSLACSSLRLGFTVDTFTLPQRWMMNKSFSFFFFCSCFLKFLSPMAISFLPPSTWELWKCSSFRTNDDDDIHPFIHSFIYWHRTPFQFRVF